MDILAYRDSVRMRGRRSINLRQGRGLWIGGYQALPGPVRVSDVETAQQRIVDVVRRLEDAGEIIISGRGGEKELIV